MKISFDNAETGVIVSVFERTFESFRARLIVLFRSFDFLEVVAQ
jgi:hypothetical protein